MIRPTQSSLETYRLTSSKKIPQSPPNDSTAITKAAAEFESLFLNEMLKVMRRTVPKGPDTSMATEMFTSMMDAEVAKLTAGSRNGLGIAKIIEEQLMSAAGVSEGLNSLLLDGDWIRPIAGNVGQLSAGQRFGALRTGERREDCGDGHCGVDLGRQIGAPVRSVSSGIVTRISENRDSKAGLWVELKHRQGKITTRYMHLNSIHKGLKIGARVQKGQLIGEVGNTGTASDGAHLHFELYENTQGGGREYIDAEPLLRLWGGSLSKTASQVVHSSYSDHSDHSDHSEHLEHNSPKEKRKYDDVLVVRKPIRTNNLNDILRLVQREHYKLVKASGEPR